MAVEGEWREEDVLAHVAGVQQARPGIIHTISRTVTISQREMILGRCITEKYLK